MSRIAAIAVLAAMCLTLFGVDRSALAAQQRSPSAEVVERVARLQLGEVLYVVRPDGTRLRGVLVAKTDDSITIDVYRTRAFGRPEFVSTETLALASVQEVTKPLTGGQKVAIAVGVFVGTCTIVVLTALSELGERTDLRPRLEGSGSAEEDRSPADETSVPWETGLQQEQQPGGLVDR